MNLFLLPGKDRIEKVGVKHFCIGGQNNISVLLSVCADLKGILPVWGIQQQTLKLQFTAVSVHRFTMIYFPNQLIL